MFDEMVKDLANSRNMFEHLKRRRVPKRCEKVREVAELRKCVQVLNLEKFENVSVLFLNCMLIQL